VFDIYTIVFLAVAVFIFLRLRSVLGQRTGRDRPPYDPYSARDTVRGAGKDKVVSLPARATESAPTAAPTIVAADGTRGGSRCHCRRGRQLRRQAFSCRRARRL
jgi:predicted lipid-binding transport protein (Tim44 family)